MNLRREEKTIGALKFETTQFPAMRAFTLLAKLLKVVGPAMGALVKLDPDTELSEAGSELTGAFAGLDPREAAELVPEILAATTAYVPDATGGRAVSLMTRESIDSVFSGNLRMMFQVIGFVLQVNYRDFSEGGDLLAPLTQARSAS